MARLTHAAAGTETPAGLQGHPVVSPRPMLRAQPATVTGPGALPSGPGGQSDFHKILRHALPFSRVLFHERTWNSPEATWQEMTQHEWSRDDNPGAFY